MTKDPKGHMETAVSLWKKVRPCRLALLLEKKGGIFEKMWNYTLKCEENRTIISGCVKINKTLS